MKLTILSKEEGQESDFHSFFGRIEDTINCFRDLLTFRNSSEYMTAEFRNGHTVPLLAGKMVQD